MLIESLKKSFLGKAWTFAQGVRVRAVEKFVIPSYTEKRSILNSYKNKYNLKTLVETGTFLGDTVDFFKDKFDFVYSIELSESLARKAQQRFAGSKNISIIQGDSGEVLKNLVQKFDKPVLFWLDGHYSSEFFLNGEYVQTAKGEKDTPIEKELEVILNTTQKHIILIDDARLFNGKKDYPTLSAISNRVRELNKNYSLKVKRDIIRIAPNT